MVKMFDITKKKMLEYSTTSPLILTHVNER